MESCPAHFEETKDGQRYKVIVTCRHSPGKQIKDILYTNNQVAARTGTGRGEREFRGRCPGPNNCLLKELH